MDFINIWDESDFKKQSPHELSVSLEWVIEYILNNDMRKQVSKFRELIVYLKKFVIFSKNSEKQLLQNNLSSLLKCAYLGLYNNSSNNIIMNNKNEYSKDRDKDKSNHPNFNNLSLNLNGSTQELCLLLIVCLIKKVKHAIQAHIDAIFNHIFSMEGLTEKNTITGALNVL